MPQTIKEPDFIKNINSDNFSGGTVLLQKALSGLHEWIEQSTGNIYVSDFDALLTDLILTKPAIAPFVNLRTLMRRDLSHQYQVKSGQLKKRLQQFSDFLQADRNNMIATGESYIHDGDTYMTFSQSSNVSQIFLRAKQAGKNFQVICPESRPVNEGSSLAETLNKAEIDITLIVDAAIYSQIKSCNGVFVGADIVTEKWWANKTGTSFVCLAAQKFGVPVWSCIEIIKIIDSKGISFNPREKPSSEVYDGSLTVSNLYFEQMPLDWLSGLITGIGVLTSPLEVAIKKTLDLPKLMDYFEHKEKN